MDKNYSNIQKKWGKKNNVKFSDWKISNEQPKYDDIMYIYRYWFYSDYPKNKETKLILKNELNKYI